MKRISLKRLQARFIEIVSAYLSAHGMDQQDLARKVRIDPVVLSNLMKFKRVLSGYYVAHFIAEGVMTRDQIYDGNPASEREREFWATVPGLLQDRELCVLVHQAKSLGIDPKESLKHSIELVIKAKTS